MEHCFGCLLSFSYGNRDGGRGCNTKASKKMGERPWELGQSWGWVSCKCHRDQGQEEQKDALYGGGRQTGRHLALAPVPALAGQPLAADPQRLRSFRCDAAPLCPARRAVPGVPGRAPWGGAAPETVLSVQASQTARRAKGRRPAARHRWEPSRPGGGVLKQRGLEEGLVPARPLTARRPWISLEQISSLVKPWAACWPAWCQSCPCWFLGAT